MRTGTNLAHWWLHMSDQVALPTGNAQPKKISFEGILHGEKTLYYDCHIHTV